jgi:hypothetical protein
LQRAVSEPPLAPIAVVWRLPIRVDTAMLDVARVIGGVAMIVRAVGKIG